MPFLSVDVVARGAACDGADESFQMIVPLGPGEAGAGFASQMIVPYDVCVLGAASAAHAFARGKIPSAITAGIKRNSCDTSAS